MWVERLRVFDLLVRVFIGVARVSFFASFLFLQTVGLASFFTVTCLLSNFFFPRPEIRLFPLWTMPAV